MSVEEVMVEAEVIAGVENVSLTSLLIRNKSY